MYIKYFTHCFKMVELFIMMMMTALFIPFMKKVLSELPFGLIN